MKAMPSARDPGRRLAAGAAAALCALTAAAADGTRERLVAIGFDDFRTSDFALVAPLFEKYGARATFNRPAWRADWSAGDREQMRRLEEAGHEIGDHT